MSKVNLLWVFWRREDGCPAARGFMAEVHLAFLFETDSGRKALYALCFLCVLCAAKLDRRVGV